MRFSISILLLCLFVFPKTQASNKVLAIGKSISLPVKTHQSVFIEDGKILKATDLGNTLSIKALKLGKTKIQIGQETYNYKVVEKNDYDTFFELEEILKNIPFLEVSFENTCIEVKGKLLKLSDWILISKKLRDKKLRTTQACGMHYQLLADFDPSLGSLLDILKQQLKDYKMEDLQIVTEKPYLIQISIDKYNQDNESEIRELLSSLGLQVQIQKKAFLGSRNLSYEVEIVLLKKEAGEKIGILPPTEYSYNFTQKMSSEDLVAKLNLLGTSGSSKSLIKTRLQSTPDKEAIFHSGGELPIKVSSLYSSALSWKKYGFLLRIKTQLDQNLRQQVELQLELSNIDSSVSIDDVPGLKTYSYSSSVNIDGKDSILLSGFMEDIKNQNQEGLAWLKEVPFINKLFSKENKTDGFQELAIRLTPK